MFKLKPWNFSSYSIPLPTTFFQNLSFIYIWMKIDHSSLKLKFPVAFAGA